MKIIFISGPSGSGKTTLSNKIMSKIQNGTVLSTDNYYKTGLISKLLSKFVIGYFDRRISFNYKLLKKDLNFIRNNGISIIDRSYNFENKKIESILNKKNNINFIIVEGIFASKISSTLNNQNYYFLELKMNKNECMERVVKRDLKERGKIKQKAKNDFLISWNIYYDNNKNKSIKNKINEIIITETSNIDHILEKLFNLTP